MHYLVAYDHVVSGKAAQVSSCVRRVEKLRAGYALTTICVLGTFAGGEQRAGQDRLVLEELIVSREQSQRHQQL